MRRNRGLVPGSRQESCRVHEGTQGRGWGILNQPQFSRCRPPLTAGRKGCDSVHLFIPDGRGLRPVTTVRRKKLPHTLSIRLAKNRPMSLYHIDTIKDLSRRHGFFSLLRTKFLLENGSRAESPLKAVSLDYRAGSLAGV